mmetsp:Transcript_32853/g.72097  ORF Transcript_32853/g.72097 Transcript_32853/m.72097 type:complete len:694 (-) Transcript_32853:165-2246(-)
MPPTPQQPGSRQTTVLIGGSNGTASLVSILGDRTNPRNAGHTIRVVTRNPARFIDSDTGAPLAWRCNEQKAITDFVPSTMLPTSWVTHVGAADSVLAYDDVEGDYGGLERAISGLATADDGGSADVLVLCCPVSAHLSLLRRIARALYRLEADGLLGGPGTSRRPLLIGTLYAAGGFDWMARIAFASEKPRDGSFSGKWSRPLALFGLKAFPYLCKSTEPGIVTMYGRYPQLVCALSPSTPALRAYAKTLLERILQCEETNKTLSFLGLSSAPHLGGDGSAEGVAKLSSAVATVDHAVVAATGAATAAAAVAAKSKDGGKVASTQLAVPPAPVSSSRLGRASSGAPVQLGADISVPLADHADPNSAMAFLTCTLNATNQILHPCILKAFFHDPSNPEQSDKDGTIPWDASKKKTAGPRFYGDGANNWETGRLITQIAGVEFYQVIDGIDTLLAPAGMAPVSAQHGGEPVGRFFMTEGGNHPRDIGRRSGLTDLAIRKHVAASLNPDGTNNEQEDAGTDEIYPERERTRLANFRPLLEFAMSYGLSNNVRLGSVLAPVIVVPNDDPNDKSIRRVRPNPSTRFFHDDLPHGLCLMLGLGTILGCEVERDMPETLACVRKLQRWMGKEYVTPEGSSAKGRAIIETARDLAETSAPQAFGVRTVDGLKRFLSMSIFGEELQQTMERRVMSSSLVSNL